MTFYWNPPPTHTPTHLLCDVGEAQRGSAHSHRDQSPCEHQSRRPPGEEGVGSGGGPAPSAGASERASVTAPHAPVRRSLSLRNLRRPHHLVHFVVQR